MEVIKDLMKIIFLIYSIGFLILFVLMKISMKFGWIGLCVSMIMITIFSLYMISKK